MQTFFAKKFIRSAVNVTSGDGKREVPPNRYKVVKFSVYSETVYGLVYI